MKRSAVIRIGVFWRDGPVAYGRTFWPFGKLVIGPRKIVVEQLSDAFSFLPGDIVSVQKCWRFPFPLRGVEIHHNKGVYPERISIYGMRIDAEDLRHHLKCLGLVGSTDTGTN